MPGKSPLEMLQLNLQLPRGDQAFWELIRDADKTGPWTVRDIADRTNRHRRTVSQLVERLQRGDIVSVVGSRPTRPGVPDATLFRLNVSPIDVPRLRRDGTPLPEPETQTLWRIMRMVREFTARELHALATQGDLPPISLSHARGYLSLLKEAGLLLLVDPPGGGPREARYRLLRDCGPRAPKVIGARIIYDPNAEAVIGSAQGREVRP